MCQLLGMNCNTPTDVTFSFSGFAQRGGNTGEHTDGWGIAFFEGDSSVARLAAFNESFLMLAAICALAMVAAWRLRDPPRLAAPAQ